MEKIITIYPATWDEVLLRVKTKFVNGVYLHGKAKDIYHQDLFEVSEDDYELFKKLEDGIYKVLISSGEEVRDGIMYFWTVEGFMGSRKFRGLVCFTDDTEGIDDAKKKFEERREFL